MHFMFLNSYVLIVYFISTPLSRKYRNPPETFQTIEKNLSLLDTNSTTQRKCYPPVDYPPPPKKNKHSATRKNRTSYLEKKMSSSVEEVAMPILISNKNHSRVHFYSCSHLLNTLRVTVSCVTNASR